MLLFLPLFSPFMRFYEVRNISILKKEQAAQELKRKYFGADGEFYERRDRLMKPIMDEIFKAVEEIAKDKGYQAVFDRSSSATGVIYYSPQIDISNEVLLKLGYA
jgi:outer membrane protein